MLSAGWTSWLKFILVSFAIGKFIQNRGSRTNTLTWAESKGRGGREMSPHGRPLDHLTEVVQGGPRAPLLSASNYPTVC